MSKPITTKPINHRLLDPELLRQGSRCPDNHHQASGTGVRLRNRGACLGCRLTLPPGLMPFDFPDLPATRTRRVYANADEAYAVHLERVKAYNQAHRSERLAYAREYNRSPDVGQRRRENYHTRLSRMTPEEIEALRVEQRERVRQNYYLKQGRPVPPRKETQ